MVDIEEVRDQVQEEEEEDIEEVRDQEEEEEAGVAVAAAVAECFPSGIDAQQESEVLRVIFRHLRRRESA